MGCMQRGRVGVGGMGIKDERRARGRKGGEDGGSGRGRWGRVKGDATDVVICGHKSLQIPPAGNYSVFPKHYPHNQI